MVSEVLDDTHTHDRGCGVVSTRNRDLVHDTAILAIGLTIHTETSMAIIPTYDIRLRRCS